MHLKEVMQGVMDCKKNAQDILTKRGIGYFSREGRARNASVPPTGAERAAARRALYMHFVQGNRRTSCALRATHDPIGEQTHFVHRLYFN